MRQQTRIEIVHDVDPADERDVAVDHDHLAVQPAQTVAAQGQWTQLAAIDQHLHARFTQTRQQAGDEVAPAEAVDHHPDRHPPLCRAHERISDAAAGEVIVEDVALQEDLVGGAVDRRFQRREVLLAVLQQRDRVAGQELHQDTGSRSAVSAAWSEICAHGAP